MSSETPILIRSKEHFEELMAKEKTLMLYFSSNNCNVCHAVLPKVMDLVEGHSIKIANINIDDHMEIVGQFLVFTVPTILIMHENKEILRESRFIDFQKVERILRFLDESLLKPSPTEPL